jgi:hypothetical protein
VTDVFKPPPPLKTDAPAKPRPIAAAIPPTAGDTDSLAQQNSETAVDQTRADFRVVEFNRTILQHGKRVRWRKAMICPCLNDSTGQADLSCTDCDGSGFVYVDPLDIQALMFAFEKGTRLYEKFGLWASGEVAITAQAAYRLGYRDSLELYDDVMNFNELIKKGDRSTGKRRDLPPNTETARYRIVTVAKAVVRSGEGLGVLEQGYHFRVTDNGLIEWMPAGNKFVKDGDYVSLHYDFHPVWIVTSHPHAMRSDVVRADFNVETTAALPLQVSAQLDFIADANRRSPVTGP